MIFSVVNFHTVCGSINFLFFSLVLLQYLMFMLERGNTGEGHTSTFADNRHFDKGRNTIERVTISTGY